MKQPILFLFLLTLSTNAQWTPNGNNITTTNNVGIGAAAPSGKLEILKDADLSSAITLPNSGLVLRADNDGNDASLRFGVDNSNLKALIQTQQTTTAAKFDLLINPFGGNIGIGTTNPANKFHVSKNPTTGLNNLSDNRIVGVFENTGGSRILIGTDNGSGSVINFGDTDAWNVGEIYYDHITDHLRFRVNNQVRMTINDTGNVGIGTTNPNGWKLAVNGNIRAKEIKVETGWSDFVFYENYNLPTLEEVETHIKEKGHLKDIPSAKDVTENGILLGEMDAKLLQKIEELMLYTIEQQKEIKNLKHENKQLKSLAKRMAKIEKLLESKN